MATSIPVSAVDRFGSSKSALLMKRSVLNPQTLKPVVKAKFYWVSCQGKVY